MTQHATGDATRTESQTAWTAESPPAQSGQVHAGLTVLFHPESDRVGDRTVKALRPGQAWDLSRLEPVFAAPVDGSASALGDRRLSRTPLRLVRVEDGGVRLEPNGSPTTVMADGHPVGEPRTFRPAELDRGVVLLLGNRVTLLLHWLDPDAAGGTRGALIGESAAIVRVRQEIERVARLPFNVLIRGESGTGKELVAQALHGRSPRRHGPFVAINVAAVPPGLAAAELFGATKGAYSGADRRRQGSFQRADGGTLFLDEIGEAPVDLQALLLRALDTSEIQPVGGDKTVRVDVRVVAATDANLEQAIAEAWFRLPLLHRLTSYEIFLPPLRERREDFGRLFFHFLRGELDTLNAPARLLSPAPGERPWVPARLVAILAAYDWPGNVRQLRNVVRQLVVANLEEDEMRMTPAVERYLDHEASPAATPSAQAAMAPKRRDPRELDEIGEDEVRDALRRHRWQIAPTAATLRVSRPSVYNLMKRFGIRTASELHRQEIEKAIQRHAGDLAALVEELQVSKRGLKIRMTELGLSTP